MAGAPLDLVKGHRTDYATPAEPELVHTTPGTYLAVDGVGRPGSPAFQDAIGALYSTAYTLKFQFKARGQDFKVAPLEGLWTGKPGDVNPATFAKRGWRLLIRMPPFVPPAALKQGWKSLEAKGRLPTCAVNLVKLDEGDCVQVLHIGPYDKEAGTIARLHEFAQGHGLRETGTHHEVYLSDPGRTPATRLRTIVRYPVSKRT